MEEPETHNGHGAARRGIETLLHIIACVLLFWAFSVGSYTFPVTLASALALVTLLSLLTTYELAIRGIGLEWAVGAMIFFHVTIMGGYGIWCLVRPPEPTGALLPAGDPTPATACPEKLRRGDLEMNFATDRVVGKGGGPFVPFTVDSCPVIALQRKGAGLMVEAAGYDWSNDVVFLVRDNVYQAMEPLQLRVLRPDRSTFVLLDRFDQEVIYVRYLNPGSVRIRGRFLCGEAPQAVIRDGAVFTGGVRIGGAYLGLKRDRGNFCATVDVHAVGVAIGDTSQPLQ